MTSKPDLELPVLIGLSVRSIAETIVEEISRQGAGLPFPDRRALATLTGYSKHTAQNLTRKLAAQGWLRVDPGNGRYLTVVPTVPFDPTLLPWE
ncbi:hypothetical protein [Amycolatopsis vastitatis]|uniref:hypothetical protein n=1 Tax=Amycolatopsis vastitatis TaxID=1905142 RepID=UPI001177C003|nr:hypothetical protein [Amycolatopsis vastitatis]